MIDENFEATHDFVTCISWVRRGVARQRPEELKYGKEELRQVIQRTKGVLLENGALQEDLDVITADVDMEAQTDSMNIAEQDEDDDIVRKYGLDTYDDDSEDEQGLMSGMGNLVKHADAAEDPYLQPNAEEDESDLEDFLIQPNDNLMLVGHVQEDAASLDVYLFNEEDNYVHHDVILPAFPMCFEPIEWDVSTQTSANLMASGDMTKHIRIWDLDVINQLEPKHTLRGHKDAVLGLSWNRSQKNILASCSVDKSVRLWDLTNNKTLHAIKNFTDRVQSCVFNSLESEKLLVGDCSGKITLIDCNTIQQSTFTLPNSQIEKVLWVPNTNCNFIASTNNGQLVMFDTRSTTPVQQVQAHEKAITDLAFSCKINDMLVSAGEDSCIKVWDLQRNTFDLVYENPEANVGEIYTLSANPDLPFIFAVGGNNAHKNLDVLNFKKVDSVKNRFLNRL